MLVTLIALTQMASAHASLPAELARHEVPASVRTAICEARLGVGFAAQTNLAVGSFREFRVKALREPGVEPKYVQNFNANASDRPGVRRTLAEQIRGLETWTKASDDRRLGGFMANGTAEIDAYFRLRHLMGDVIEGAEFSFVMNSSFGATLVALRTMSAGVLLTPLIGVHLAMAGSYVAFDPAAAFGWRFDRDQLRRDADRAISTFLDLPAEDQRNHWAYTSRAYRVSRRTIEALWSGDAVKLQNSLTEDLYESTWYINRYLLQPAKDAFQGRPLRDAWSDRLGGTIIVDQLVRFNTVTNQPELAVAVRTTSRRWPKLPRPSRAAAGASALSPITAR